MIQTDEIETRTLEQVKIYKLILNDMRSAQIEMSHLAAASFSLSKLVKWHDEQRVAPYRDGQWGKNYRQGSPLEWYNTKSGLGDGLKPDHYGHGIREEWVTCDIRNAHEYVHHLSFEATWLD